MRIVKKCLERMCPPPALEVFLDKDNMAQGRGTDDVDRSRVVCVFVSQGYFTSPNW